MKLFHFALWVTAALIVSPTGSWAIEAAPLEVELVHADDGSTFWARPRGTEYGDWMETLDGYTVVESLGVWYYAQRENDGTLSPSPYRVGRMPSSARATFPKHLHPPLRQEEHHHPMPLQNGGGAQRSLSHTQRVLTILVDFSDIGFVYSDASFRQLMFGDTNSVKHYYNESTYGQISIVPAAETQGVVNDGIVHVTMPTSHPNFGTNGWNTAVGAFIAAADSYVNFADFDTNGDGTLSADELSIVLFLAGYENSYGGTMALQPRIWGHKWQLAESIQLDGTWVSAYTAMGERHATHASNMHMTTLGIVCHELGHLMLGLPDLYDLDGSSRGIGDWGLMGGGSWNRVGTWLGDSPALMSAWSKTVLDIVTPTVDESPMTSVPVYQGHIHSSIRKLWIDPYRSPRGEYFLLENRQFGGYDAGLPASGLLIWHIDETRTHNRDETRKWVDLEEADGFASMDADINDGDIGDPFPGLYAKTAFNGVTNPNSDSYTAGPSGVAVDGISTAAATMTVNVTPYTGLGGSLYYNERGYTKNWGFNDPSCWTAIAYVNDTGMDRLDGFEVHINDTGAIIDFHLYESLSGTTPTGLLHTEPGFEAERGWNRFMLASPQPFAPTATRVVVLNIQGDNYNYPASADGLGQSSGRSYLSSNGAGAFSPLIDDLSQTALLGKALQSTVYVNFSFTGVKAGTAANPFNTFAEGLAGVQPGGTIVLNGAAADTVSSWKGALDLDVRVTSSGGSVRIGVNGGGS